MIIDCINVSFRKDTLKIKNKEIKKMKKQIQGKSFFYVKESFFCLTKLFFYVKF